MGESLVEAPKIENKMGESVPCLQESVSFGRFEHDSLCWERWSTFPSNKYLEEVEKCSTPGSVAQKKAYFEAHYKKVAARKAELDEQKKRETGSMNSEDQSRASVGSVSNNGEEESDGEKLKTCLDVGNEEIEAADVGSEVSVHVDEQNEGDDIIYEREDLQLPRADDCEALVPEMENYDIEKPIESVSVEVEGSCTMELKGIEELPRDEVGEREMDDKEAQDVVKLDSLENRQEELGQDMAEEAEDVGKFDRLEGTVQELPLDKVEDREVINKENKDLVKSEIPTKIELLQCKPEEREVVAEKETKVLVKLGTPKKVRKEMPIKKTNITTNTKTKPACPMSKRSSSVPKSPILSTPKSANPTLPKTFISSTLPTVKKQTGSTPSPMPKSSMMLSTPKSLKPSLSKSAISTTRPSVKKETGHTPPTSKKATSLHMSLSLGPPNSDPDAVMTTRKSLIMDRMGDKDIVKRAFKAFRNFGQVSQSGLTKAPATDQFGDKKTDKCSVLDVSQKKHERSGMDRINRVVKPSSPASGTRKSAISSGLYKTSDGDKRTGKSLPGSLGARNQDQGHKQKEVSKNLEQKSRSKEAGKMTHLESKVKLEKPAPVKTPTRESFKAKLSLSYNQGHGFFRGLRKDVTKSQASS